MDSGLEDITWRELVDMIIDARQIDLHTAIPARVDSYDTATQTVSVTPMVNKMVPDGATPPNYISEPLPKLSDVPVLFPRCKKFLIAFPLEAGDSGLIVFNERNISAWRATGHQSDPGDLGMHTLSAGGFIPGIYPESSPAQSADGTNMVVGSDTDGNSRIEFKPAGGINLGAGATDGVASGTKNDSNLQALAAAIAATSPTVGPTEPLAVALKGVFASWIASYVNTASTKIKTVL